MKYKMDSWLVHLARAGDEDACEKLVKKYYSSIYQYCLLHINDPYEAEDLTQEVFTRFFSNLYRYKEYGKVKNYLYTIAGNTVKNYYKKKKDIPSEELLKSEDCSKNHVEELGYPRQRRCSPRSVKGMRMPVPREASLPEIHSERHSPADNRRRYRTVPYLYVFPAQGAHRRGAVLPVAG